MPIKQLILAAGIAAVFNVAMAQSAMTPPRAGDAPPAPPAPGSRPPPPPAPPTAP